MALCALLLVGIGIAGATHQAMTERQRELAVRAALGATPREVMHIAMKRITVVLAMGLTVGLVLSLASLSGLRAALFDLDQATAPSLFGAAVLLAALVLLSGYLPARRATQASTVEILRGM